MTPTRTDNWTAPPEPYGFRWGPARVTRIARVEGRGGVIGIDTGSIRLQVWISEKGQSVRIHDQDGNEWFREGAA